MSTPKEIWLPKSELNVRTEGHEVQLYEHMVFTLEPIKTTRLGFGAAKLADAVLSHPYPDVFKNEDAR